MKRNLFLHFGMVVFAALLLTGCPSPGVDTEKTPPPAALSGTPITIVSITIPAPVRDEVPATTATASGTVNFTIGTVTWSPADNPFQGGKVYTASVTLTAASDYTFTGLTTAKVNTQTATVSNNTGGSVTLSYAFPATDTKTFKSMSIKAQPSKLTYSHNDTLELAGLTVTLNYTDNSSDEIAVAEFAAKNITTSPANGDTLSVAAHNGKLVTITYGSHTANTNALTVNPIAPVLADFTISGTGAFTYDSNPKTVTVTAKDGKTTGTVTVKYNGATTAPSNAGTYAVTFDVTADTNYTVASGLSAGTLTIKAAPTAADFTISGLSQAYDGSAKAVTVTAKTGITGMGTATVKYDGNTNVPSMDGTYAVTFDVAEGTNYTAASGLSAGTLTITLPPFTTIDRFGTWLSNKPANIANTAYNVVLNVNNLGGNYNNSGSLGYALNANITKYVNLDLSGSAFTSIEAGAFRGCTSLTSVNIPTGVTTIGISAFYNCTSLTSVNIPTGVTTIGDSVFYNCTSLASVTIPNNVTSIETSAFRSCTSLTSVTIPNNVTSIGTGAFRDCTSLTSVTIPTGVTTIGDQAFSSCSNLTSITIPNSVTGIRADTFRDCTSLTSITIPTGVTTIGDQAFSSCYNLTSITIPDSVTSIGDQAFLNCGNLTSVKFDRADTTIGTTAFVNTANTTSLQTAYTAGSIGTYTRPDTSSTTWTKTTP